MPKHRTHKFFTKSLLGKPYEEVHRALDLPFVVLGRKHRVLFHTMDEAFCLGYINTGEWKGSAASVYHVWLDRECSKDKEFKRFLDWAAMQDVKFDKEMRKL